LSWCRNPFLHRHWYFYASFICFQPLSIHYFWLGDYPTTALSIAGQAGIITDIAGVHRVADLEPENGKAIQPYNSDSDIVGLKSIIITGPELMALTPAQVEQLCQYEEIVFARTTPEQKLRIVHEFKSRGNVVAVIGDGVNDAPSLKAAACGVAMSAGSDVAKEAADLVLLGEFSSIIVAIEYGKAFRSKTNIYDDLKSVFRTSRIWQSEEDMSLLVACRQVSNFIRTIWRVAQINVSYSFSELIPILLNVIIGVPQILSSIQWVPRSCRGDKLMLKSLPTGWLSSVLQYVNIIPHQNTKKLNQLHTDWHTSRSQFVLGRAWAWTPA
jgi:sodium/potassium-transporting ATPase subunit alpha